MNILFYDTKSYDRDSFEEKRCQYPNLKIDYLKSELTPATAKLAKGYDAVCAFVNCDVGTETVELLHQCQVRLILLRSAGFNHVDIEKARAFGIKVMRVPGYSTEAVAEHAMALALAANRRIHKAYVRVRENDFSLGGMLLGSRLGRIGCVRCWAGAIGGAALLGIGVRILFDHGVFAQVGG